VVLTGSHNLDLFSLRGNDETLIEVRDQQIYDQYNQFLDQILFDARSAGLRLF
jgi:phosphatidylserine/phosphatidylglycerophosphate/cardiolipin synthase-like enzyme